MKGIWSSNKYILIWTCKRDIKHHVYLDRDLSLECFDLRLLCFLSRLDSWSLERLSSVSWETWSISWYPCTAGGWWSTGIIWKGGCCGSGGIPIIGGWGGWGGWKNKKNYIFYSSLTTEFTLVVPTCTFVLIYLYKHIYYYIVINIFLLISMENNCAIYPCICTLSIKCIFELVQYST